MSERREAAAMPAETRVLPTPVLEPQIRYMGWERGRERGCEVVEKSLRRWRRRERRMEGKRNMVVEEDECVAVRVGKRGKLRRETSKDMQLFEQLGKQPRPI